MKPADASERDRYDWAKDAARCYDEAIAALREKAERGEPVTLFGRKVVMSDE